MSSDIRDLSITTERLCDSLRDLRRENPECFFGQPVEKLYRSLEAALDDFYRAKAEEDK
jgi:hypothetical protein